MRVLLVHDQSPIEKLTEALQSNGFAVDVAPIEEVEDFAAIYDYGLVGIGMSKAAGCTKIIHSLKEAANASPVIVMLPESEAAHGKTLLGAGADDVLTGEVAQEELVARCQVLLRRKQGFCQAKLSVGELEFDQETKTLRVGGNPVKLSAKELAVIEILILHRGVALSKQAIYEQLYAGIDGPNPNIICVFISKIRRAIRLAGGQDPIRNVHSQGYLLKDGALAHAPIEREPPAAPAMAA